MSPAGFTLDRTQTASNAVIARRLITGLAGLTALAGTTVSSAVTAPDGSPLHQLDPERIDDSGYTMISVRGANHPQLLPYIVVDDKVFLQGDILLKSSPVRDQNGNIVAQSVAIQNAGELWDNGVVPYEIDASIAENPEHAGNDHITRAITHWEESTSIRFVKRTPGNQAQYPDYIRFRNSDGCSSYVGHQGGEQVINLNSECGFGGAVHEIGHAIGLFHEQSRSDRDDYVSINWANIPTGLQANFEKISSGNLDVGRYDYQSVMHYAPHAFSTNGAPTIEATTGRADVGQRSKLSQGDVAGVQHLYPADVSLSQTATEQANAGDSFTVNYTVTNQGDPTLGNVIAKDIRVTLPLSGASFVDASSTDNWLCNAGSGVVVCSLKWLEGEATSRLDLTLQAPASNTTLGLSPTVSASNRDVDESDNQDNSVVQVLSATTKTADAASATDAEAKASAEKSAGSGDPAAVAQTTDEESGGGAVGLPWLAVALLGFVGYRRRR